MAFDSHGLLHFSLRKRIHSKREEYPNPNKKIRTLDKVVYVVGILGPLMMLPQIIKIYTMKSAEGLSFISYLSFAIFSVIWVIYGQAHKEKPIIITHSLWIIFHLLIVMGVLIYGNGFW
ncbi:MAG: SemiSWEET family transporter [Nanoarchaeota archaeon]|nr:SemiSWEET family transporter [Nanoarchaeota archaeon]